MALSKTLRRNLATTHNEAEVLHIDLTTLTNEELIELEDVLIKRTMRIMTALDNHVDIVDSINP